jgi:hypothetical protein
MEEQGIPQVTLPASAMARQTWLTPEQAQTSIAHSVMSDGYGRMGPIPALEIFLRGDGSSLAEIR